MSQELRNILVGALVVVTGAAFIVYASRGGVEVASDGYELTAVYQNVDGVAVGTDALLAGIKVGEVVGLDYVPEGHRVAVRMRIRDDVELPVDSVAMIVSAGMLGGKYLKLEPGGDLNNLRPGDSFDYVQDAVIFEELLQKVVLDAESRRLEEKDSGPRPGTEQPLGGSNPFGSLLK